MEKITNSVVCTVAVALVFSAFHPVQAVQLSHHATTVLDLQTALTSMFNRAGWAAPGTPATVDVLQLQRWVAETFEPPAHPDATPPSDQSAATLPSPVRLFIALAATIRPLALVDQHAALPWVNMPEHSGQRSLMPQKERYLFQLTPNAPPASEAGLPAV